MNFDMLIDYSSHLPQDYKNHLEYFKLPSLIVPNSTIPFLSYKKNSTGDKTILITAGFDGDEMDGILAALKLPALLDSLSLPCSVIVLPICNPEGFLAGTSFVPDDKSFPKYYFASKSKPINKAQVLVNEIFKTKVISFDLWIDLHGGSSHERLAPYLVGYDMYKEKLNLLTRKLLSAVKNEQSIFVSGYEWKKINALSLENIPYILSEAGEGTTINPQMINLHISRTLDVIKAFVSKSSQTSVVETSYIERYFPPKVGQWKPVKNPGEWVSVRQTVGQLTFFGERVNIPVRAKHAGKLLWIRKNSLLPLIEPVFEINYKV